MFQTRCPSAAERELIANFRQLVAGCQLETVGMTIAIQEAAEA